MKNQRHKRKESFSVLLVSNTDRSSRQFNVSLTTLRVAAFLLVFVCILAGVTTWLFLTQRGGQNTLKEQIAAQEARLEQFEQEKAAWNSEKEVLTAENDALRQAVRSPEEESVEEADSESMEEPVTPDRYPFHGACVTKSTYSEEQPYLALTTYEEGTVIATGDGTVVTVSSDDTYHHIVEIDHTDGYRTRYLCHEDAELNVEEGAQVSAGDILLTITTDDTQLDYQILQNGEPLDPFSVIDAKG